VVDERNTSQLSRWFGALGLASLGTVLAFFVGTTLEQFENHVQGSVRAAARVVGVEEATCQYTNRRKNRAYPCLRVEGEWSHDGQVYRAVLAHYPLSREIRVGDELPVVFEPDPAAAAGRATLFVRVADAVPELGRERKVYLGLLGLAGLLCLPLLVLLVQGARTFLIRTRG
jgi:hypothetical protein